MVHVVVFALLRKVLSVSFTRCRYVGVVFVDKV